MIIQKRYHTIVLAYSFKPLVGPLTNFRMLCRPSFRAVRRSINLWGNCNNLRPLKGEGFTSIPTKI